MVIHGPVAGNEQLHNTAANTDDLASDATVAATRLFKTGDFNPLQCVKYFYHGAGKRA